jgi:hypothetical protein
MEHISAWSVFMLITVIYWAKKHTYYKDEHKDLLVAINYVIPEINADTQTDVFMSRQHHAGHVTTKMHGVILSKIWQS